MIVYSRKTVPKYTFGVVGFFAKRIRISWINLKAEKSCIYVKDFTCTLYTIYILKKK